MELISKGSPELKPTDCAGEFPIILTEVVKFRVQINLLEERGCYFFASCSVELYTIGEKLDSAGAKNSLEKAGQ